MVVKSNNLELSPFLKKGHPHYSVQTFRDSSCLAVALAEYLRFGLTENEGILLITSSSQWRKVRTCLNLPDARWDALNAREQIIYLDAQSIFAALTSEGPFKIGAWNELIDGILSKLLIKFPRVRCSSELENLFFQAGRYEEANRLGESWNQLLASRRSMSVLCSYNSDALSGVENRERDIRHHLLGKQLDLIELESPDSLVSKDFLCKRIAVLEQRNLALRARVEETQRLQNELLQAGQELKQAGKLKNLGELCASIVHELNQPLTIVKGGVEQALEAFKKVEDPQNDDLKDLERWLLTVDSASARMVKIVKNVLLFASQQPRQPELISVNAALKKGIDLMSENLALASVELKADISEAELHTLGEEDLLVQVFINILSNARDALVAKKGRKCIEVTVGRVETEVAIVIADNGSGMSEGIRQKAFDPFFTTKDIGIGTGLGLSISRGIINEHMGRISCDSTPGIGTRFTICLPLQETKVSSAA